MKKVLFWVMCHDNGIVRIFPIKQMDHGARSWIVDKSQSGRWSIADRGNKHTKSPSVRSDHQVYAGAERTATCTYPGG